MDRVSTNFSNNNMNFHMRNRELEMSHKQNQMASQQRIQQLRDDPIAAAHSTRLQSYDTRLARFEKNTQTALDMHNFSEGQLRQGVEVFQRVRELAVQGAHGVYSEDDLQQMGVEVDELLREMIAVGNSRDGEGKAVFGGAAADSLPFQTSYGNVPGAGKELVTEVRYTGDITGNMTEVSEGSFMPTNFPGNEVFWAESQEVYSTVDASEYQVPENSVIQLQGQDIELQQGDSVFAVMAKINAAGTGVKANLDPVENSMALSTTSPQQLWVEDREGGTVLQDLGIVGDGDERPPHNYAASAQVYGGSAFDMVINLRDSLMEGQAFEVGGDGLRGIDTAMDKMMGELGRLGAQHTRLEMGMDKLSNDRLVVGDWNSEKVDLNMAEAITDLKRLEGTHQAALATAARIMQPTLLDFMR